MGVNLWGESPLYENLKVFIVVDTTKSTSRRQGRLREEGSEGSPMAKVRADGQKPHIRLSLRASQPHMAKPTGSGDRVNAAFVHRKFTFLSGEICASCDRRFMRAIPERSIRLDNDQAYSVAVDGYESLWETQSMQRLIIFSIAPFMETWRVSTQKSAEGIVVLGSSTDEGPNVEMSGASNELDVGGESDRMSQASACHGIAFPRSDLNENCCAHCRIEFNLATAR
jgi:hypothetical protein